MQVILISSLLLIIDYCSADENFFRKRFDKTIYNFVFNAISSVL